MRRLVLVAMAAMLFSNGAHAQVMSESYGSVIPPTRVVLVPSEFAEGGQGSRVGRAPTRRCCSVKGALIGAAIGAAGAIWLTRSLCDAGDCTSSYAKSIAILGGVGAGIGAFTARPSISAPVFPRTDSSVAILPMISNNSYGGAVSVSFGESAK